MKLLAIDIGKGTQDILLYDTQKEVENSLIMIMPSPTAIIADRIRKATDDNRGIVLTGDVMGGGPCVRAVKEHIGKGLSVYATENAALTINDNLGRVRSIGVKIVDEQEIDSLPDDVLHILLQDIDTDAIFGALLHFGVDVGVETDEQIKFAVALQDHGESPDISNRVFRFDHFKELIKKGGNPELFTYSGNKIPKYLTRIKAAHNRLVKSGLVDEFDGSLFMDTGPAAIFGALLDNKAEQPSIVVNIGNGHTLGALVVDGRVKALFEHHTSRMDAGKLQDYILRLAMGTLTFDEVFNDGGHGCYIGDVVGFDAIRSVMVTGPKRGVLQNSNELQRNTELWEKLHFAAPFGNMMLSGCFGLLSTSLEKSVTNP
ncbi:MAG TPA: pyruvate formate lyase-activating protein [Methanosarcinaceae archaeon]|nr:pyruvate formate lyase-activating protein [Methanosarcinaceae archaeon]